jgi:hypothetical protein
MMIMNSSEPFYRLTLPSTPGVSRHFVALLIWLVAIEFLFVFFDLTINWWKWSEHGQIRRMFNITREDGVASVFAVLQTYTVALVAWFIVCAHKIQRVGNRVSIAWIIIAVFFTYMAIDDGAMVHERFGTVFKNSLAQNSLSTYGWHFVMGPIFAAFGLFILFFLWNNDSRPALRGLLILALFCLSIGVLLDILEGVVDGYLQVQDVLKIDLDTLAHFSKSAEEFLEMCGMSLFMILFLEIAQHQLLAINATIDKGRISIWR